MIILSTNNHRNEEKMSDYVNNKILFDQEHLPKILETCFPTGYLDFNTLIPQPLQMYRGNTTQADSEDFKCNWLSWNCENWGTKWNACESSHEIKDSKAIIKFDTAWNPPRPIIVAFANKFEIPFQYKYKGELDRFFIVEEWILGEEGVMIRKSRPG
jgi:hypothetical protein